MQDNASRTTMMGALGISFHQKIKNGKYENARSSPGIFRI